MNILSSVLDDTIAYEAVLDHGCHCARLDQFANNDALGGPTVYDALDEICKQWFLMRSCNDGLEGGTCKDIPLDQTTYLTVQPDEDSRIECGTQTDPYSQCKSDACETDIFFAYQIVDYLDENPSFTAVVGPSCPQLAKQDSNKTCSGEAPNFAFNNLQRQNMNIKYTLAELTNLCEDAVFDLTILVDGSGSVSGQNYDISLTFVEDLLQPFNIGPDTGRVTLAQFSSDTKIYTTFSDDEANLLSQIDTMGNEQFRQLTHTNEALKAMSDSIISHGRSGVPQFLIVITDGESTNGLDYYDSQTGTTYNTAEKFHSDGVTVFGIGVGYGISQAELQLIATDPDDKYLYELSDFEALDDIRLVIAGDLCTGGGTRSMNMLDGLPSHHMKPEGPVMYYSQFSSTEEEWKREMHMALNA